MIFRNAVSAECNFGLQSWVTYLLRDGVILARDFHMVSKPQTMNKYNFG